MTLDPTGLLDAPGLLGNVTEAQLEHWWYSFMEKRSALRRPGCELQHPASPAAAKPLSSFRRKRARV